MKIGIYYAAFAGLVLSAAWGVFLVATAFGGWSNENTDPLRTRVNLARGLSGLVNLLLAAALYRLLGADTVSNFLIVFLLAAFSLWEWYARTHFIEVKRS